MFMTTLISYSTTVHYPGYAAALSFARKSEEISVGIGAQLTV